MGGVVEPCFKISVNGSDLDGWLYNMITKCSFKESDGDGANEALEICFDDPELQVMEMGLFTEKKTRVNCKMGYIGNYGDIFSGVVEEVLNDYPKSGKITLKITARDIGYLMSEDEKTRTWRGKTYSDVASDIFSEYGLNPIVDDTSGILPRAKHTSTTEMVEAGGGGGTTYTVKPGDCLWNIAKKFYGAGAQYPKIFEANKGIIKNPNLIYPNQVLTIPDIQGSSSQTPVEKVKTDLTILNQSGETDLKFLQNMADRCHYKLLIDSATMTGWFVKQDRQIKSYATVNLDYKCGNEKLKSFRPKFNDYDRAMGIKANNINIDENRLVPGGKVKKKEEKAESSGGGTYTVVSGDCLWNIAKKFYGSGAQYVKIYNANKNIIKNPNLIYPGQVLTIP